MDNVGRREHCNGCQHFIYWYPYETPYCRLADMREIPYPRPESPWPRDARLLRHRPHGGEAMSAEYSISFILDLYSQTLGASRAAENCERKMQIPLDALTQVLHNLSIEWREPLERSGAQ